MPISSKVRRIATPAPPPEDAARGDKRATPLVGATLQGWFAPNITPDAHKGIGGWSKQDLVADLKTGAPNDGAKPPPVAAGDSAMKVGAAIYKDSCAACHKDNGSGERHLFPKLAGSALVQSDDPTTLAHVVLMGAQAAATDGAPTGPAMPAFNWRLNDGQVAAVLTYIRNSWGNAAASVAASAVANERKSQARFD